MGVEGYNREQMERLKDYKIAFDQEAMWAAMQKKKKKRRGAFFFITMALVALAIVFFASLLFNGDKGNLEIKNNGLSSINDDNEKTSINDAEEIAINQSSDLETKNNKENNQSGIFASNNSASSSASDVILKKGINNTQSTVDFETVSGDLSDISDNNFNSESSSTTGNIASSTNVFQNPMDKEENVSASASQSNSTNKANISNNSIDTNKIKSVDGRSKIRRLPIAEFPFLESLRNEKLNLDNLKAIPPVSSPIIKVIKNYKWFVGGYGGIGKASKSLDRELISDTEDKTLEEVSVGLELKYQIRPNIYVSTGLEYWHTTDRRSRPFSFEFLPVNEEIRAQFDLEETVEGFLLTTSQSVKHTMYQTLNVPLMIGYGTSNEHFNLFAEAGALYNFNVFTRGDLPEYQNSFFIGSRNQITPQLGLGMSYRWTNGLELFTRANWRGSQHVTKQADGEFGVQEKYSAIRGQVGLRIGF